MNGNATQMVVVYKCAKQVLPNVWHHNVLVDKSKARVIENSEVPMSEDEVVSGIKDGILATTDGWVRECD